MADTIDWKTELRKIEREFSGLPPEPTPKETRRQKSVEQQERERAERRVAVLGTWGRLVLAGVLGGAIFYWPYSRACGFGLYFYLLAESLLAIGAGWAAIFAWKSRLAVPHVLALALALWGVTLVEIQVLPRAGYITIFGSDPVTWSCPARN